MGAIKSFKKFIKESIWSDIQDRSSGEVVRKEDDVNNLDLTEFYAYIKDQYKTKVEYIDLDAMGGGDVLGVDITENIILFYKPKRGHILLSWSRVKIPMPFFDELTDRFKVEHPNAMRRIITEKDGSCTNKTFVDVIDFFIMHKESMMNESIWSDIQDRSSGDVVRKEDEYDIDEDELERNVNTCIKAYVSGFVYSDKYDGSSDTFLKCIQEWDRYICSNAQLYDRRCMEYVKPIKVIPSYVKKNWETGKSYKSLVDKKISEEVKKVKDTGFIKKPGESIRDTLSKWFNENVEELEQDFCDEIEEHNEEYHREGGSRYTDLGVEEWWEDLKYIEQIEIYQEYMKKTNESIWSDIQDRSSGEANRKEDDVNLLDKDGLYEYLISHYKPVDGIDIKSYIFCGYSYINLCVFTYPTETRYSILLDILNCRVKVRTPYIKRWPANLLDMIYKKYNREDIVDKNRDHMTFITPKEGKGNNQFYIDFLDMILNNVDKPLLKKVINESIWSDIQDRSSGETVREEDITEEDKKEIDYIFNGFAYLIVYTDYKPTIDDFIKMMKEAYPDFEKDNSKYIAWVRSNWDKKYKDELDKKIQDNKKDVDKRINKYLNNFVGQVVYREKYNVSLPDIKKFSDEILKHCGIPIEMRFVGKIRVDESWLDIFKKYVDENWNDVKKRINDLIVEENQKIAKTGFKKTPGKKICDILDEWWDSLGDEKEDIAWDEFGERAEEKYYERHNPKYNEYTGEDFDADEEWSNASWIESVEIYMKYNQKTNESIWSDIQDRSSGDVVRKEDEMTQDDLDAVDDFIYGFAARVVWDGIKDSLTNFLKYIDKNPEALDCNIDRVKKYVEYNWHKSICDDVEAAIEQEDMEKEQGMNESIWSDIQDRSSGENKRREDEVLTDMEINSLNEFTLMYCRRERAHYIQNHIVPPPPSKRKENDYEGLIKYIEDRRDENLFTNVGDYEKIIEYIKKNWDKLDMDTYIKKWICSPDVMKGTKLVECDGVPGGLTPADVGGMGPAYFPGPNGEPGSGDLPSPTGIVYKQVAPFDTFIKMRRPKKNKKKKFRKEDEPCVHSPNAKVYAYVDDFRDYVDRTYNNMDRRK